MIESHESGALRQEVQGLLRLWRFQFAGFHEVVSPTLVGYGGRFLPLAVRSDGIVSVAVVLEAARDAPDSIGALILRYTNCLNVRAHGSNLSVRRTTGFFVPTDSRPEVCLAVMDIQVVDESHDWIEVGFSANDEQRSELLMAWRRADLGLLPMLVDVDPKGGLFFEL